MSDRSEMMPADRQIAPAVDRTLAALTCDNTADAALHKLAESYARAIDRATSAEAWADAVLRKVDKDTDLHDEVRALKVKLTARAALSDLGPKLAVALVELGATPRSRAAMAKLVGQQAAPAGTSELDRMRAARRG